MYLYTSSYLCINTNENIYVLNNTKENIYVLINTKENTLIKYKCTYI